MDEAFQVGMETLHSRGNFALSDWVYLFLQVSEG